MTDTPIDIDVDPVDEPDSDPAPVGHICEGCGERRADTRIVYGSDEYWCPDCRDGEPA